MQFKVPQDVQRADTIVGPLTWKQLIILAAGGGIAYAIYITLAERYYMEVWLPPIIVVGGLTLALAFIKIHGLTFERFLLCFIEYHFLPKKRIWRKGQAEEFVIYLQRRSEEKKKIQPTKKIEEGKKKSIKELSDIVDTYGNLGNEVLAEKQEKKKMLEQIINHTEK